VVVLPLPFFSYGPWFMNIDSSMVSEKIRNQTEILKLLVLYVVLFRF
jgi:hypothetical protein